MIRLEGVGFRYGRASEILHDVTLQLRPGWFHFLTGPSGSGKTTLLRLLMLSLRPTRGTITLFGQDVSRATPARRALLRRRVGVVFQDSPMLDYLTVWDNVALPLHVIGKLEDDYREDVTDLLQWVGLGDGMNLTPPQLSGGERQRASIARAVLNKPELLLADEPTASVDPVMARRLLRLFIELNRLGMTVLIATHDYQLMRQIKAPTLVIQGGTITSVPRRSRRLIQTQTGHRPAMPRQRQTRRAPPLRIPPNNRLTASRQPIERRGGVHGE